MKTVDGVPQFDHELNPEPENMANEILRDYFSERKCVNCKYYGPVDEVHFICDGLFDLEMIYVKQNPKTFFCAAFEVKS